MEKYYPSLLPWWWGCVIKGYAPEGYVDSSIYDFQNLRSYLNAVYLRGALMLQDLRTALGDEQFFAWIRNYLHARQGKLATTVDFLQALSPADYIKTGPVRAKYLHNGDTLHIMPIATAGTAATTSAPISTVTPTLNPTAIPTKAATETATGLANEPCCG